jgi:hypothetical protein
VPSAPTERGAGEERGVELSPPAERGAGAVREKGKMVNRVTQTREP